MSKIVMRDIKNCIILLFVAWVSGTIGLLFAYCIPSDWVKTEGAVKTFQNEGPGPQICEGYLSTRLDNYSDSIMINTASYKGETDLIEKTLMNYHHELKGTTPFEAFLLKDKSTEEMSSVNYARYWHGHLLILKPLLCLMEYSSIRFINTILQSILMIWIAIKMYNKGMKQYIIPLIGMFAFLSPIVLGKSLQYSAIFYIMTLAILFLLYKYSFLVEKGYVYYFMIIVGCAASYFGFLTYPIVSLCVPMVFLELLNESKEAWHKERIKKTVMLIGSWGVGYIGMWAGKWVITSLLTGQNIIKDAILSVLYRISSGTSDSGTYEKINSFLSLKRNLEVLCSPFYYVLVGMIIASIFFFAKKNAVGCERGKALYLFLVGMIPFLGIMLMCNHSYVHYWMTYRNLSASVLAWGCALAEITGRFWIKRKVKNE